MENRFTFRDLVVCLLLVTLIVLVVLGMFQYDRQWEGLKSIERKLDAQAGDLRQVQMALRNGVVTTAPSRASPGAGADDAFARVRAAQAMPGYARGDWMVDAFGVGVRKLTPLLSADVYASVVQDHIFESLAARDPATLEWKPLIAESWQISPDGLQIRFQLKKNVTFSDGQPLTADDVKFTYDFTMDERIAAPRDRAYLQEIAGVDKVNDYEVVFRYKRPYFEAFQLAAGIGILPKHFYSKFTPQQFNESVGLVLGSGPYRMEDPEAWKPGALIVLVRNERYWGVEPALDRLVFKEITNDVAHQTAFRNGEIDEFPATPEQYTELLKDKPLLERTQHFAYTSPLAGYRFIAWNQRDKDGKPTIFADKRVRQALTMLIDRQKMIQVVMLGYATPATGPFSPLSQQYDPGVKPWPYDVARARALLREAGLTVGADNVLRLPDGTPFKFKLTYGSGSAMTENLALFIKDALASAGVIVEQDPLEWAVFTDRLENKNFQAIMLGWSAGVETDIYQIFHSSQMAPGADDFVSYKNEELDKLIEQARATVKDEDRMPLWRKCHQVLAEDQPYTFLFFPKSLRFVDSRCANVQVVKLGLSSVEEWFVPLNKQRWNR